MHPPRVPCARSSLWAIRAGRRTAMTPTHRSLSPCRGTHGTGYRGFWPPIRRTACGRVRRRREHPAPRCPPRPRRRKARCCPQGTLRERTLPFRRFPPGTHTGSSGRFPPAGLPEGCRWATAHARRRHAARTARCPPGRWQASERARARSSRCRTGRAPTSRKRRRSLRSAARRTPMR